MSICKYLMETVVQVLVCVGPKHIRFVAIGFPYMLQLSSETTCLFIFPEPYLLLHQRAHLKFRIFTAFLTVWPICCHFCLLLSPFPRIFSRKLDSLNASLRTVVGSTRPIVLSLGTSIQTVSYRRGVAFRHLLLKAYDEQILRWRKLLRYLHTE